MPSWVNDGRELPTAVTAAEENPSGGQSSDLDPRLRQALLIGGAVETGLKVATLIDLARRPPSAVRGSKSLWALALALVNSGGILPVIYLLRGRAG
ncbi:hypothetical protein CJ179_37330 [Rhodococcus sp. ACS1]|uniref:DUF5652 family protein n=1 Tax=Rhodococcus sp. ACS1 TaxID=2028570 RepID=UPI000BB130C9|nr:DUF5652 family protein [Rhodococcus sp. ACS1]PBC39644.1 hypothetical protein CJ179_37330 [Rhodococcus sp. ACS1]